MNYLLLAWLAIGLGLRLLNLGSLPPWTDECATLVFSLGNSFRTVALDRVISGDVLLQPLQPHPDAGFEDVFQHLMTESTHPPVYFLLAHGWMRLFPPVNDLASIWAARFLPALLGTALIPAVFGCSQFAFGSRPVAQLAAAMMAVSPFAVYLSQEARHYTLAMLFIVASLSCLFRAVRAISGRGTFPFWGAVTWIVVNSLGIAVHYFFALTLCSEFFVLVGFGIAAARRYPQAFGKAPWTNIYLAIAGTLMGGLVWVPVWLEVSASNLTDWVADGSPGTFEPLLRLVAWVIAMLALVPLDPWVLPRSLVWMLGAGMLVFFGWAISVIYRGLRQKFAQNEERLPIQVFGGVILGCVVLMLGLTYGWGKDLTLAPRFSFIYVPALIVLIGAGLSEWRLPKTLREKPRLNTVLMTPIFGIVLIAMLGSLTVVSHWGYLQTHRSDRMANFIYQTSEAPVLIATTHRHHGHTGRMMGLAWEFHQLKSFKPGWTRPPQFLLAHNDGDPTTLPTPTTTLKEAVAQSPRPIDVWAVNFNSPIDLAGQKCDRDEQIDVEIREYRYKLYHCFSS